MYDFPPLRPATDALWHAIAQRLGVPAELSRDTNLDRIWTHPDLLMAQTCGYPLMTSLAGRVKLVATPRYTAHGCDGANYRSAVVVRRDHPAASLADMRGGVCAINDAASNSGMNLLRAAIAPLLGGASRFFAAVRITGSHAASVMDVADGQADLAAIDCISWAHMQSQRPGDTSRLRVLAWTPATPGLPLITAAATPAPMVDALTQALLDVARDPALAWVRGALLLDGFDLLPLSAYDGIVALEQQAIAGGYPVLR